MNEVHISFGTIAQVFAGSVTICGAIILILNRFGIVRFGKKKEEPKAPCPHFTPGVCPDPSCQADVKEMRDDVKLLDAQNKVTLTEVKGVKKTISHDIFPRINKTAGDVEYIRGRIDEALKKI